MAAAVRDSHSGAMLVHICDPSSQEAEARGSRVQVQSETFVSKKKKNPKQELSDLYLCLPIYRMVF
jgi:hypothetical protein